MLILTRRPLEAVMIGDDVVVTVLGVSGNHVRIGIKAPKHMRVDREEVRERINQEGLRSASSLDGGLNAPQFGKPAQAY